MIENDKSFVIQHNVDKAQLSLLQKKKWKKTTFFSPALKITNICRATIIECKLTIFRHCQNVLNNNAGHLLRDEYRGELHGHIWKVE